MNYIYDIYLNFNKTLYDFYEWNKNDNLIHIKKTPIFIIDSDTLRCITTNDIKIDSNFITKIINKTEVFSPNNKNYICALFSDYDDIIAIEFDKNGNSINKSVLYIDEENEIIENLDKDKICNISFKLIKKTPYKLKTRRQIKTDNFINSELKNIDSKKLRYICYECLGTANSNFEDNLQKLKTLQYASKGYKNLYDILKLTSKDSK